MNSLFNTGSLATDMMILDDIAQTEKARQKAGLPNAYRSVSAFDFQREYKSKWSGKPAVDDDDELLIGADE